MTCSGKLIFTVFSVDSEIPSKSTSASTSLIFCKSSRLPKISISLSSKSIELNSLSSAKLPFCLTFTMSDIDKLGIKEVIENTIEYLKSRNVDDVHLSLDVDALDPLETPGTGTRVLGGLSYRESHFALELLHQSHLISSMDLVEVNPLIDSNNHTAEQAVSLVGTFFGETLL